MLSPPTDSRGASFDSTSSGGSANRSPTPRAALQPTITVSLSPDNIEDYKDLFTLPRKKLPAQKRQPSTPASEYRDNFHDGDSNIKLSPTPPTSPRMQFPNPPSDSRLTGTRRSESTHRDSQSSVDDRPNQVPKSPKTRLPSMKRQSNTPKADDSEELARNSRNMSELGLVIDISPPSVALKPSPSLHRSRLRTPTTERPSQPPSIPLPEPPKSNPIQAILTPPYRSSEPSAGPAVTQRRRAHTIGSVPPASKPPSPIPTSSLSGAQKRVKLHSDNSSAVKQSSNKENANLDTATIEELREALVARNRDYEELANYLVKVTASHVAEKKALERRISTLEKDMLKKDNELRGFAFLVNNPPHGSDNPQNQVAYRQSPVPQPKGFRMLHSAEDSGAESHQTSGAESIAESFRGSATSGTESPTSMRVKRVVRSSVLADAGFLGRAPSTKSTRGLGIDSVVPEMPLRSSLSQRSSVYSLSSSSTSTSSASSLLPPSPSGTTLSSLSAIPESPTHPTSPPPKPPRVSGSLSAGEAENQRHSSRTSRRISTPTLVAPSSAQATSAYSANLKRGRPPSIAQVLEKSPLAQEVLETPRSVAGSPRIPSS